VTKTSFSKKKGELCGEFSVEWARKAFKGTTEKGNE
jgi:hypothetical protein